MNDSLKNFIALSAICLITAVFLSTVKGVTSSVIDSNEANGEKSELSVVYPELLEYESIDILAYGVPSGVEAMYHTSDGGYIVKLSVSGYKPGMVILCGISGDGRLVGASCLSSSETNGTEKTYGERFVGRSADEIDSVDTVSGSTKTTKGYKNAIKSAFDAINSVKKTRNTGDSNNE